MNKIFSLGIAMLGRIAYRFLWENPASNFYSAGPPIPGGSGHIPVALDAVGNKGHSVQPHRNKLSVTPPSSIATAHKQQQATSIFVALMYK
jgi:hypothetical protein